MPEQNNKQKITNTQVYTIIGLIFLIVAIPFSIAALRLLLNVGTGAEAGKEPEEIVTSNISESSVLISWATGTETQGQVKYGTSESNLDLIGSDIRDVGNDTAKTYKEHIIEIKSLSPTTTYFYQVVNDGQTSATASFKTHAVSESVALPKTLKGKLSTARAYALVYVFASTGRDVSEIRSTYTSANGTFTYDISDLRTADGSTAFPTTGVKLVTYVNAFEAGKARKVHAIDADPATMTLDTASTIVFTTDVDITSSSSTGGSDSSGGSGGSSSGSTGNTQTTTVTTSPIANTVYNNSKANSNSTIPTNIFMSNITPTSFQVNWVTKEATKGYVNYGKTTTLNKSALDVRDSSVDILRFTHSIVITDASMTEAQKIYFKIVSNSKSYGLNGGSSAYVFVAPKILTSPPTPKALTGTLSYLSGSKLSSSNRDFLIYSKVKNTAGALSSYISTVPAFKSNGWSLSIGGARSADFTSEILPESLDTLYVLGEYNSVNSAIITDLDATAKVSMAPGLSVGSVKNGQQFTSLSTLSTLSGTGGANTNVNITINQTTYNTTSDSVGDWDVSISVLRTGNYTMELSNGSQVLGLSFNLSVGALSVLPATGISTGTAAIIIGFVFVISGFVLVYNLKRGLLKR